MLFFVLELGSIW